MRVKALLFDQKPAVPIARAVDGRVFHIREYVTRNELKSRLDALETRALGPLRSALEQARDALIAKVKAAKKPANLVRDLTLPRRPLILMEVRGMLDRAWEAGQRDARSEVRQARRTYAGSSEWFTPIERAQAISAIVRKEGEVRTYDAGVISSFVPNLAVAWLRSSAFYITGLIADHIINEAKGIILNGIKTGEASSTIAAKLLEAFLPYIGDDTVLRDAKVLTPHRLETIVRTNTTAAYNHGRLTEFMDPDLLPFLKGVRYSAILDERTTPVCDHLHGKVFKPSDKDLEALLPPNHFNCRSVIVPVVAGEKIEQSEFITPSEVGKARELADAKFLDEKHEARTYASWDEA